jgi:hypothetical protein
MNIPFNITVEDEDEWEWKECFNGRRNTAKEFLDFYPQTLKSYILALKHFSRFVSVYVYVVVCL